MGALEVRPWELSNAWLLLGAVIPALLASHAQIQPDWLGKFSFSCLISLATVVITSVQLHVGQLGDALCLFGQGHIRVLEALFLHLGIVVAAAWFCQVVLDQMKERRRMRNTVASLLLFVAVAASTDAVLLHNWVKGCPHAHQESKQQ